MRYRYLSYRYEMTVTARRPRPLADLWRTERLPVPFGEPSWRPAADVYQTPSMITVIVELAGVEQDDIDVLLFEDAVVVEGRRQLCPREDNARYQAAEIRQGPFRVEIPLRTRIEPERVEARYEHGLLWIRLPRVTAEAHRGG